jgi:rhomboid protease GluP
VLTLVELGANYQPNDLAWQIYRYIGAIFLHVNFLHIFGNLIVTFLFVSRVEHTYGPIKTLVVYLASGIAANIFSVLVAPDNVKAGASTSLYGIIGIIMGYIVINWNGLDLIGPMLKCQVWCTALMIIFFILFFTPTNVDGNIDWAGHFGGFLAGIWLSFIHETIVNNKREKIFRVVFFFLFLAQLLVTFFIFQFTQQPVGPVI